MRVLLAAITAWPVSLVGKRVRFEKVTRETPDIAAKRLTAGGVAATMTPSGFSRVMIAERAEWKDIAVAAAIKTN